MNRFAALVCAVFLIAGCERRAAANDQSAATSAKFPAAPPAVVQGIEALLDEGFEVGPKKLQAAQKRLAGIRKLAENDPRVDFAWGLVLLKQAQHKPAVAQFEASTARSGIAYWPAWQGLIWGHLADRQFEKGLNCLDEFAALVQRAAPQGEMTDAQRDAARWMGEVLESLDKTVEAKKLHELIDRHEERLREVLSEDLVDAFELGRDVVEERSLDLHHRAGEKVQEAAKKSERKRKGQSSKLDSDLEDLDKQKETAAKTAEEWKEWLDDMLSKADKQLGQLEKDYKFLDDRAKSLDRSITLLGQELTAMQMQMQLTGGGGIGTTPMQQMQNEQQLIRRQNQMLNYQIEYNATVGRLSQTAQQGRQAMGQRSAIVQRYEKATGDLVKKTADIDKWTARINDKKQKLDVNQPAKAKGKTAKLPAERKIVLSFKNYLPLDLDGEKARVLSDLGVKSPEPIPLAEKKNDDGNRKRDTE